MSKIQVNDLNNSGADLFEDTESYMSDLDRDNMSAVSGGLIVAGSLTNSIVFKPYTTLTGTINTTVLNQTRTILTGTISPVTL